MILSTAAPQALDGIDSRVSPWLMALCYPLGRRVLLPAYFGAIEIIGQEHLPRSGPAILAPTHRSRWDALLLALAAGRGATGRDLRFMVTSTEIQGFQGWWVSRLGGFPVDLTRLESHSLRYSVELLLAEEMLVIFPEGGIHYDRRVYPLKRGVARIALETEAKKPGAGTQVLPVALQYSDPQARWRSRVTVKIGAPLRAADYDPNRPKSSSKALTEDLQRRLQDLMGDPGVVALRE